MNKFIIPILVGAVCFSISYYYLYSLPAYNEAELRVDQERLEQEKKHSAIDSSYQKRLACISEAESDHQSRWKKHCQELYGKDDCGLPKYIADGYNNDLSAAKEYCLKLIPE